MGNNNVNLKKAILTSILAAIILLGPVALSVHSNGSTVERPLTPSCSNDPKSSIVELAPAGTPNAIAFVEFTIPFCSGPVVVVATVNNHNTAGERVGVQAFGVYSAAVSVQLDAPSSDTYEVYWMAMRATQ